MSIVIRKRADLSIKTAIHDKSVKRRRDLADATRLERFRDAPGRNDLAPTLSITNVPVDVLKPAKRPLRKDSAEHVEEVVKSITQFGICRPILIDEQHRVIDGHAVLKAAKTLGIENVPFVPTARR